MLSILQSCNQRLEVNCGPQSEVIVLGTPKHEIQLNVKAFAHAAVDVSERGIASIHLDERSIIVLKKKDLYIYYISSFFSKEEGRMKPGGKRFSCMHDGGI